MSGRFNAYDGVAGSGSFETVNIVSGRVGTLARHSSMGVTHGLSRIHHSVSERPASFPRNSFHYGEVYGNGGAATGNVSSAEQRGYRRSTPLSDGDRFLQPLFRGTEKRRRVTTHSGFTPSESCTQTEQIQDVDGEIYSVSDPTKRLVYYDRSEGCVFPYSDRQETQEVPQIRFRGQSVSVPRSSLWLGFSAPYVLKVHGRSSGPVAAPGRSCVELFGRLAGASAIADSSTLSPRSCAESFKQPGLTNKFQEECFNSLSTDNFSWNRSGLSRDDSEAFSPARSVDCVMRAALQSGSHGDSEIVPQALGSNGSSIPRDSSGIASNAPLSVVDEKAEYFTPLSPASHDFGDTAVCDVAKILDVNRISPVRSSTGNVCFPRDCHDGRVFDWLGSCVSRATSPRSVDSGSARLAYKQTRITGSFSGSPVFRESAARPSCAAQIRQHSGCVLSEPSRRIALSPPVQAGEACSSVVSGQVSLDPGHSCPRTIEFRSGSAIQTGSGTGRMAITPPNGESFMADIRQSESGFIRVEHDYALPAMVLPTLPIAPGRGCVSSQLAQDQSVCFSSDSFDPSGIMQNTVGQSGSAAAGGSAMAHAAVVCGSDQSASGLSLEIPLRQDLLSQAQGLIWHPRPDLWKLWAWPLSGVR